MTHKHEPHFENLVVSCQDFYPQIHWITSLEFIEQRSQKEWQIVDVRTEVERAVSVIPGAISINEFNALTHQFREHPVLVYCTVGCRSAGYAQTLHEQGIEAYNLWGGVIDWAHHNGEFVTLTGMPTREVHTHGRRWNLLPPDYIAVW